jgi:hypothetical protein
VVVVGCIVVVVDNGVLIYEGVPVVNGAPVDDAAPVVDEDVPVGNGVPVDDTVPGVDGGTVVVGVEIPLVNVVLVELGVTIAEDLLVDEGVPNDDGVPVDEDPLVVEDVLVEDVEPAIDVVPVSGATAVVDWGTVVVGYGVPVEDAVVPDVDERLVEEGGPAGNDELVVVVVPIAAAAAAAAASASAIDSVVAVVVDWGAVVVGYGVPVEAAVVEDDGVPDVDVLDGAVVVMGVINVVVVISTHAMIPMVTPRGLSKFCVDVIIIINTVPFGT